MQQKSEAEHRKARKTTCYNNNNNKSSDYRIFLGEYPEILSHHSTTIFWIA